MENKRYRFLKVDEIIADKDECRFGDNSWMDCIATVGETVTHRNEHEKRYRRPIKQN